MAPSPLLGTHLQGGGGLAQIWIQGGYRERDKRTKKNGRTDGNPSVSYWIDDWSKTFFYFGEGGVDVKKKSSTKMLKKIYSFFSSNYLH